MPDLAELKTGGAQIEPLGERSWRLSIPAGDGRAYRVAQLDDYNRRQRRDFPWKPPLVMSLRACASSATIPGTWGFGLWNDPFAMGVMGGGSLRLPALPNAAWFFYGSPPNYLTLRDDRPAQGWLASVFRAPPLPTAWMFAAAPGLPLMFFGPTFRLLRRVGRKVLRQDSAAIPHNPADWHNYCLEWRASGVRFQVDGETVLDTPISPRGPLGLVIWVDNQYMALAPNDRPRYGWLPGDPAWIEIDDLTLQPAPVSS